MEKYCPKCFQQYSTDVDKCPADGTGLVGVADRNLVGETLDDRYTVQALVGKGGMGVVYRAEQHLVGRIVALKVLRREVVKDVTAVKRFMTEAKAIASLKSPNTITMYDFGVTGEGLLYYTMELLEGRSLAKVLRDEGPLSYSRALDFVVQACNSLEEAHDKGVLHRDLKPDNLFVTTERGKEHVTVLDFGIAKLLGDTSIETITRTGDVFGTPGYLSPEQIKGKKAGPPSDLYALTALFYEMLTGKLPFQDITAMAVLLKHLNEEPVPVTEANPRVEVPGFIDKLVRRGLKKDPAERFQSAASFRHALLRGLVQETRKGITEVGTEPGAGEGTAPPAGGTVPWDDEAVGSGGEQADAGPAACEDQRPTGKYDASLSETIMGDSLAESSTTGLRRVEAGPGPTTFEQRRGERRRLFGTVAGAVGGAAAAVLILVLWAPWEGRVPESHQKAVEAQEPATGPAVPPAADARGSLDAIRSYAPDVRVLDANRQDVREAATQVEESLVAEDLKMAPEVAPADTSPTDDKEVRSVPTEPDRLPPPAKDVPPSKEVPPAPPPDVKASGEDSSAPESGVKVNVGHLPEEEGPSEKKPVVLVPKIEP